MKRLSSQSITTFLFPWGNNSKLPLYFKLTCCSFFCLQISRFPLSSRKKKFLCFLTTHPPAPCPQQVLLVTAMDLLQHFAPTAKMPHPSQYKDILQDHNSQNAHNEDTLTHLTKKSTYYSLYHLIHPSPHSPKQTNKPELLSKETHTII